MRVLWSLLALLLLGGLVVLLMGPRSPGTTLLPPVAPAAPAAANLPSAVPNMPARPETTEAAPALVSPTTATDAPAAPATLAPASSLPSAPQPGTTAADIERALDEALGTSGEHAGKQSFTPAAVPSPAQAAAPKGTPIDLPITQAHPLDKISKARAEKLADGSLLIDEQFTIRGTGTQADPYVLPFDLLTSAENTFQPRKGLMRLPQRVAFLHDAWVKLDGYVAFPISAADPSELLVMLNQWDGCCIGVPPTAYDAVEVKLGKPAKGEQRFAVHGSVTGQFKVDPYIDSNYLLGLYVMSNATFTSDQTDAKLRTVHQSP